MSSRFTGYRSIAALFWLLVAVAVVIWSQIPGYDVGWDLHVYGNAIRALRLGHDPYADGIAVQRVFHSQLALHPNAPPPFTYVYSPLTLPLLRWLAGLSFRLTDPVYWVLYIAGTLAAIWVNLRMLQPDERRPFALLAPVAIFFPGMLENDVLFSGNVAYILYGLVLVAALVGWRKGVWAWFYVAVLAASCCKAPLLTLLAIPLLSARRQWVPAAVTGALGLGLFLMQPRIWPVLFQNYLTAVELQFSFNHDFSSSPAGLLADALYNVVPYRITSAVFYLFYALPFFGVMLLLRKRFLAGRLTLEQWVPLMLLGVLLLNPRVMEYDIAPMTIPIALVTWRVLRRIMRPGYTAAGMAVCFALLNGIAPREWRVTACLLLVTVFFAGCWDLFTSAELLPLEDEDGLREVETSWEPASAR